jgi:heme-degrading monooxygenase HmoA
MIFEIAEIDVTPGSETAFEAAVSEAVPLFVASKGCHGINLQRGIERPSHYTLVVKWATLEDHTEGFRSSPAFTRWRQLVGPHFAAPPQVHHIRNVLASD